MGIVDKAKAIGKRFKLDSHHSVERSGIIFGALALCGAIILGNAGISSAGNGKDQFEDTAVWSQDFETSRTKLQGDVDGVYTNENKTKALVIMHFGSTAQVSFDASNYQAFLLGSDTNLRVQKVSTPGVTGTFYTFGSTGYMGVLLDADRPFDQQVLNLTMRANAELTFREQLEDSSSNEVASDASFAKYDQWRVYINPGANGTEELDALESASFDPAQAYYEVVTQPQEEEARLALDNKLGEMRANQAQIESYTTDMATTKADGLFLRPPQVPTYVDGDEITGSPAADNDNGESSLGLSTETVVPGGFDFDWRSGNVYDGYLDSLMTGDDANYTAFLSAKSKESLNSEDGEDAAASSNVVGVDDLQWILSDGTDLAQDYSASDVTVRPLTIVMNNLSQAYQDYYTNKKKYQDTLLLDLLKLEVDVRNVKTNSSISGSDFLIVNY